MVEKRTGKGFFHYTSVAKALNPLTPDTWDHDAIWADIEDVRKTDPTFLQDVAPDRDSFETGILTRNGEHQKDAQTASKGGFVARTVGGAGAQFFDPVNIGLSIATGGLSRGASLFKGMAIEGGVNVGIEAVETPATIAAKSRLGEDTSVGDVAQNLAGAFVFGAAFHGAAEGGKAGFNRVVPLETRVALALEKAVPVPLMTPDEAAAFHVLTRTGEVLDSNPFADTHQGIDLHLERLGDTLARIHTAELIREPAAPKPAAPAAVAAAAPAPGNGGGIEAYIAAAKQQESGGKPGAQSRTSSASGLYGFTDGTWVGTYQKEFPGSGLSKDAILAKKGDTALQDRLMRRLTGENAAWLERNGFATDPGNLYVVHHLGTGGAEKILHADPSARLETLLPGEVIAANPHMRGKTAGEFIQFARDAMGEAGGAPIGRVAEAGPIERPAGMDAVRPGMEGPRLAMPELRRGLFPDEASWRSAQDVVHAEARGESVAPAEPKSRWDFDNLPEPAPGTVRMWRSGAGGRGGWFTSSRNYASQLAERDESGLWYADVPRTHEAFAGAIDGQGPEYGFTFNHDFGPNDAIGTKVPDRVEPVIEVAKLQEGVADALPPDLATLGRAYGLSASGEHTSGFYRFETPQGPVVWDPKTGHANGAIGKRTGVTADDVREAVGVPSEFTAMFDMAAARAGEGAGYADPAGPALKLQAERMTHDLKAAAETDARPYAVGDSGERTIAEVLDEFDLEDAALTALRACL